MDELLRGVGVYLLVDLNDRMSLLVDLIRKLQLVLNPCYFVQSFGDENLGTVGIWFSVYKRIFWMRLSGIIPPNPVY